MVFNRLSGRDVPGEPAGVPTLYPDLDPLQLERFLTDLDYAHIKSFDNVYILPFASQNSEPAQRAFGFGLSRLMIRNLMLLRDVSIHGPEDTSEVPREAVADLVRRSRGRATSPASPTSARTAIRCRSRPIAQAGRSPARAVGHEKFSVFLRICSTAITNLLGSRVDDRIVKGWNVAQPRDAKSLVQLGKIHFDFKRQQMAERGQAAQKLVNLDPDFVVAMWDIDEELPGARPKFLTGLKRDPYNAQLCFVTFCTVWTSKGPQPEALQFCRRAIELSPGHGKATCAPARRAEAGGDVAALGAGLSPPAGQFVRGQQLHARLEPGERPRREANRAGRRRRRHGPVRSEQL